MDSLENSLQQKFYLLPSELHREVSQYLPPEDLINLSCTCSLLRPIYSAASWLHCTVTPNNGISVIECPYWSRMVPLKTFLYPERYTKWFHKNHVQIVVLEQDCLRYMIVHAKFDFAWVCEAYPALSCMRIDYSLYKMSPEELESLTLNQLFNFAADPAFVNLNLCGDISLVCQMQRPEVVQSLEIKWDKGMGPFDCSFPNFCNLECFVFKPPEYFPINQYMKIMEKVACLPKLRQIETLHYLTGLSHNTVGVLALLPTDLEYCEVQLSCRKLWRESRSNIAPLELPQVTHLKVEDLRDPRMLSMLAHFPRLTSFTTTRCCISNRRTNFDQPIFNSVTKLVIYSKTRSDAFRFAMCLSKCVNLKALTFVPIALNYNYYSRSWAAPKIAAEVERFYKAMVDGKVDRWDSTKEVLRKTKFVSSDVPVAPLINMIANPLINASNPNIDAIVYMHSLWEYFFTCIEKLPVLEYLAVSEYYVLRNCINFRSMLKSTKTLKQVLFSPEKEDKSFMETSDLGDFIVKFPDESHVLDVELLMRSTRSISNNNTQSGQHPPLNDWGLNSCLRTFPLVHGNGNIPIAWHRGWDKIRYGPAAVARHGFSGWLR
ncbi:uncharacterized protein SAPINGB_P001434 [Magnusiomyces paraingens]|uniref:F-box domain-containing protein n=1 Tax=Magnusiomyces paraingens TaxID=2606893 RepID=A0A5E8B7U3_9ASCO|nr:uncharacterized protein SAPINGB_P001434 [Saprochaete ingens]VVT46881.1 unnamed protein product [Saprochaete ingens]